MPVPNLSIIVVSMQQHLERCLRALDGRGYEVIVVDNASTDATVELVHIECRVARWAVTLETD